MEEPKKTGSEPQRPPNQRGRDQANDQSRKRTDYAAGADGEQDVNAGPSKAEDLFKPDRDGSGW